MTFANRGGRVRLHAALTPLPRIRSVRGNREVLHDLNALAQPHLGLHGDVNLRDVGTATRSIIPIGSLFPYSNT